VVVAPTRKENEALRRENAELRMRLAVSEAHVAELTREVRRLATLVAQGNDRITELLAIAQRKKSGGKRSTDKAPEPPLALDDAAKEAFAKRPAPPMLPKKKKRAKKKRLS
jgi:hypothetical protein